MPISLFRKHRHPKVIAHRGNSAQSPENTYIAFRQAIHMKVDFLECDVQLSKDRVPVVIHDGTFHRITHNLSPYQINELDLEDIKMIDAGSWFDKKFSAQRVLTLEEFLCMPKGKIGVMLDIKEETVTECGLAKIVGDTLKAAHPIWQQYGPVLVGSLNPNTLLCLKGYLPEQKFIPIIGDLKYLKEFRSLGAKHYAVGRSLTFPELVEDLHDEGAQVWVWTVDDKNDAVKLIEMGVDGLITNQPKKMMALHE